MIRISHVVAVLCLITVCCCMTTALAETPDVKIQMTYPVGKSPKVFTSGWLFGAKVTANGKDISNTVTWSGSGVFSPNRGNISRPKFKKAGTNSIILSVDYAGEHFSKKFTVIAVSPDKYAAVGDMATCPSDSHGCPMCPHSVRGPISQGSSHVLVRGKPAARKGDRGQHKQCCGSNSFTITSGDSSVLIDGKPAAQKGDATEHCGGSGRIGTAAISGGNESFSGPAGPSTLKLTLSGSRVTGTLTAIQTGVRSNGTISGSYNPKTGVINAQVTGTTKVSMEGQSSSSTWNGPLVAKRKDDEITGTFTMRVHAGGTSMSEKIPIKLSRIN